MEKGIKLSPKQLANTSQDLLALGFKVRFRVMGESMEPTILAGDLLTVAPNDRSKIRLGQVVMIISDQGRAIVHRVVSCQKNGKRKLIQTCGDNASVKDRPIEKIQVLGEIVEVQRGCSRVNSSCFLNGIRALWYLIRACRVSEHIEKDS